MIDLCDRDGYSSYLRKMALDAQLGLSETTQEFLSKDQDISTMDIGRKWISITDGCTSIIYPLNETAWG